MKAFSHLFFFFSSRRRHTRCSRDWSSDVCSSDLLSEAIFALPNCTKTFQKDVPYMGVIVQKAPVLDGVADHMKDYPEDRTFVVSKDKPVDVAKVLRSE